MFQRNSNENLDIPQPSQQSSHHTRHRSSAVILDEDNFLANSLGGSLNNSQENHLMLAAPAKLNNVFSSSVPASSSALLHSPESFASSDFKIQKNPGGAKSSNHLDPNIVYLSNTPSENSAQNSAQTSADHSPSSVPIEAEGKVANLSLAAEPSYTVRRFSTDVGDILPLVHSQYFPGVNISSSVPVLSSSKLSPSNDEQSLFSNNNAARSSIMADNKPVDHLSRLISYIIFISCIRLTDSDEYDNELDPIKIQQQLKASDQISVDSLQFNYNNKQYKAKSYATAIFANLRHHFGISNQSIVQSFDNFGRNIYSGKSKGKSGSYFYYSTDKQFIIKTLVHSEARFLRELLPNYKLYISSGQAQHSLLPRLYGFYKIRYNNQQIYFILMNNLFDTHLTIQHQFDLKGSSVGRTAETNTSKVNNSSNSSSSSENLNFIVYKDNDALNLKRKLVLSSADCDRVRSGLMRDVEWLERNAIMDYSLCVGIHQIQQGNLPTNLDFSDRGIIGSGYLSAKLNEVYYVGIIDILQQYSASKKLENSFKSIKHASDQISSVNPILYAARFRVFMMDFIRDENDSK
jgi:hypothetical protein